MADPLSSTYLGFKGTSIVAALTGGAVAAVMGGGGVFARISRGIVGALVSLWFTPVVIPMVAWALNSWAGVSIGTKDMPLESVSGAVGFALGVTGMILVQGMLDAARRIRDRAVRQVDERLDK